MQKFHCCIVGGGPAGMMLGLLLARSGVKVIVLEKHADFLRDFRGDTVHPSTLEIMRELGLLEDFLTRPHDRAYRMSMNFANEPVVVADFSHLKKDSNFVAFMPQWDFLDFLLGHAKKYSSFQYRMEAHVTSLLYQNGKICGVKGSSPQGNFEFAADLVVGADGRSSDVRKQAGLEVVDRGAPIDILWMKIPREASDPTQPMGRFLPGKIFVMLQRGTYWQCGYVIPKGKFESIRIKGIENFRTEISQCEPMVANRVAAVRSWDDVKLLTVKVDHLKTWYTDGLLCIGDAAHAMSPVGGVGINLAIQDAVAAANSIALALKEERLKPSDLAAVQKRRFLSTDLLQRLQIFAHERVLGQTITRRTGKMPWGIRLIKIFPFLRRIPARIIGVGIRPEHVRSPTF